MRFCTQCGAQAGDNDIFCAKCGKRLTEYAGGGERVGQTDNAGPNIRADETEGEMAEKAIYEHSEFSNPKQSAQNPPAVSPSFYEPGYRQPEVRADVPEYDIRNEYYNAPYAPHRYRENKNNLKGILALIFGIVSIAAAVHDLYEVWQTVLGLGLAIAGMILGIKRLQEGPDSLAKAGKILSIIGVVLNAVLVFAWSAMNIFFYL